MNLLLPYSVDVEQILSTQIPCLVDMGIGLAMSFFVVTGCSQSVGSDHIRPLFAVSETFQISFFEHQIYELLWQPMSEIICNIRCTSSQNIDFIDTIGL